VIHTTTLVHRYSLDYNTERRMNVQVESLDHLPVKPVRMKLMRWGYNVGPFPSATGTAGLGTGRYLPSSHSKSAECEPGMCDPVMMDGMNGGLPVPNPVPPASAPLMPPPAPAADLGLTTCRKEIRVVGYQSRGTGTQPQRAVPKSPGSAAWMFTPPKTAARTPRP